MVVWGGKRKLLGTSPMAFACPRPGKLPMVWDQASGVMAQGEILLAAQRGEILPQGVGLDAGGRPTTDPRAVLDGGSILPFGGYKGSSIAFMIEVLAGALTGGPFGFEDRSHEYPGAQTPKAGQTVILINSVLVPGNRYFERIESLFEAIAASGVERLPAERRYARREYSLRDGIPVSDATGRYSKSCSPDLYRRLLPVARSEASFLVGFPQAPALCLPRVVWYRSMTGASGAMLPRWPTET
jgi:delta1-piperideine-2-carboxylate reductase